MNGVNQAMNNTLNFALIGCGVISPVHARSISEIPGARLAAVCDIVEDKARRLAAVYPADVYPDYRALLAREDIDVIDVLTPSGLHAEIGVAAARAGKHVIVEKSMDITREKADALIAACRKAGVKLGCIFQHRFDRAALELKRTIDDGELGCLNFGGAYTQWYRSPKYYGGDSWRGTWALDGGGALINQSIHYIDLLQYFMGPVSEVHAYCARRVHDIEAEDTAVAVLRFASGALGVIEGMTSAYPGFQSRLEIFGSAGGVVIEDDVIVNRNLGGQDIISEPEAGRSIAGTSSKDIWHLSHKRQIEDMIDAINEDRDPLVGGVEGRKALEIVLAIYESNRTGKPVSLQHDHSHDRRLNCG